jgi:arsenate reductase-like glutaredoxin family protein
MNRNEKIALIMQDKRKCMKMEYFEADYGDEWDEMPDTLEERFEKLEEYINDTYDDELLDEIIEDEGL